MAYKSDEILVVLKDLKSRHGEISASMVAKKGLEGVIMFPESFKQEVMDVWEPLGKAIDGVLGVISRNSSYNMEKAYFEMLDYGVSFYILSNSDTALVLFLQCNEKLDIFDFMSKNHRDICSAIDKIVQIIEKR